MDQRTRKSENERDRERKR